MLAWCVLTAPIPTLYALAPTSGLTRSEDQDDSANAWRQLEESPQWKIRTRHFLEAWEEMQPEAMPSTVLEAKDKIFLEVFSHPQIEWKYATHPLGPDRLYLQGVVKQDGPLKDAVCYCVLSQADKTARLLSEAGLTRYLKRLSHPYQALDEILVQRKQGISPEELALSTPLTGDLLEAVDRYDRDKDILSGDYWDPHDVLQARIRFANGLFRELARKHEVTQGTWVQFMLQTALADAVGPLQSMAWYVSELMGHGDMEAFVENYLGEKLLGPLPRGLTYWIEMLAGTSFSALEDAIQREIINRLTMDTISEEGQSTALMALALGSPWGVPAFLELPPWAAEANEMAALLRAALQDGDFPAEVLERLALPGALDVYRPLMQRVLEESEAERKSLQAQYALAQEDSDPEKMQRFKAMEAGARWTRGAMADVVAERMRINIQYLDRIRHAMETASPEVRIKSVRFVDEIVQSSLETVDPVIARARHAVQNYGRLKHDIKNKVAVVIGAINQVTDILRRQPESSPHSEALEKISGLLEAMEPWENVMSQIQALLNLRLPEKVTDKATAEETLESIRMAVKDFQESMRRVEALAVISEVRGEALLSHIPEIQFPSKGLDKDREVSPARFLAIIDRASKDMPKIMGYYFHPGGMVRVADSMVADAAVMPTDLSELLTPDIIRGKFGDRLKAIDVVVEADPDVPKVSVDPNEFVDIVLGQFFTNSGEAMGGDKDPPSPGFRRGTLRVRLSTNAQRSQVFITVDDTGKGISRKNLSRIFDPYFTKGKPKGTGIGLDTAKEKIRGLGGFVRAQSVLGVGTRITVGLPSAELSPEDKIETRADVLVPTQLAALTALRYKGSGDNDTVRWEADRRMGESLQAWLNRLRIRGTIPFSREREFLQGGQIVGSGGMPMDVLPDPLEQTHGIVKEASLDTKSVVLYGQPEGIPKLPPDLYMRTLVVGRAASSLGLGAAAKHLAAVDVGQSVAENLHRISARLSYKRGKEIAVRNLRGAILFKSRHKAMIREYIRLGIPVYHPDNTSVDAANDEDFNRFWQHTENLVEGGEDVVNGNMVFVAKKIRPYLYRLYAGSMDFIDGADGTGEGLRIAQDTVKYGGEMSWRLVPQERLSDENFSDLLTQADDFTQEERQEAKEYGFVSKKAQKELALEEMLIDEVGTADDLVYGRDQVLVETAIKDSSAIPGLKGIHVDPRTGEKTIHTLVAAGSTVRILETVLQGNYGRLRASVEQQGNALERAREAAFFARALAQDGFYARARALMEEAYSLHPMGEYQGFQIAYKALDQLIHHPATADTVRTMLGEALVLLPRQETYWWESLLAHLGDRSTRQKVEGQRYRFAYDRQTGEIAFYMFDANDGVYYGVPVSAAVVDSEGNTWDTDQYPRHRCDIDKSATHSFVTITYQGDDEKKDMPDIILRYEIPHDQVAQPYFISRITVRNDTGGPFTVKKWRLFYSDRFSLGRMPAETVFYLKDNIGSWMHRGSRMALALGFAGWESGERQIHFQKGDPASLLAQVDLGEEGLVIPEGESESSRDLLVLVDRNRHPLQTFWETLGVADSKDALWRRRDPRDLDAMFATLDDPERQTLLTAIVMAGTEQDHLRLPLDLPEQMLLISMELSEQEHAVRDDREARRPDLPDRYVVEMAGGKGKLVALFNLYNKPIDWDLILDDVGLDSEKNYTITDLWMDKQLGARDGFLIRGNYKFDDEEAIPPYGVKWLLIQDPAKGPAVLGKKFGDELQEMWGHEQFL